MNGLNLKVSEMLECDGRDGEHFIFRGSGDMIAILFFNQVKRWELHLIDKYPSPNHLRQIADKLDELNKQ